ncbi:hypothetical protein OO013_08795 [Mangrovivirga sp. M17]|uniref:PAS domain-containing protein n=1 Tax=Mangrovivirga halotolerans TaxID=2993936 RepID=A0ABT3RR43_9BACT|nr:hypothetical protein [Mangrovivirga halotolerans]MCX2743961.1 hypothetical protein [Mangrovivirga halotolerans]
MNLIKNYSDQLETEGTFLKDKKSGELKSLNDVVGEDLNKYEVIKVDKSVVLNDAAQKLFGKDLEKINGKDYYNLLKMFLAFRSSLKQKVYQQEKKIGVKIEVR